MMKSADGDFRSGFVGLAGVPNVGKSTLLNRLIGQKVSITSRAPQTTRNRVCGILTDEKMQAIFVDVPGILATEEAFNLRLVQCARSALAGCDLILHLRSADTQNQENEEQVRKVLDRAGVPVWEVWNKIDLKKNRPDPAITENAYAKSFEVSAKTGRGLDRMRAEIREALPPGPMLYPEGDLSDRDLRFLCAEFVREQLFRQLRQEVPYGIATWVDRWEERDDGRIYMRVTIQTEREAHRRIILGAKGATIKAVGSAARREIERLCEAPVFLDLWVHIVPKWRSKPLELKRLGFDGFDTY